MINAELARQYFPNEDPLGNQIRLGNSATAPWLTIVGVAGNVKGITLFNEMAYGISPLVYQPLSQSAGSSVQIPLHDFSTACSMA